MSRATRLAINAIGSGKPTQKPFREKRKKKDDKTSKKIKQEEKNFLRFALKVIFDSKLKIEIISGLFGLFWLGLPRNTQQSISHFCLKNVEWRIVFRRNFDQNSHIDITVRVLVFFMIILK